MNRNPGIEATASDQGAAASQNRPSWRISWLAVGIVCALVILPVFTRWFAEERERWALAAAQVQYEAGDREQAIKRLAQLVDNPQALDQTKLELADWLLDAGRAAEALAITQPLKDKLPQNPESKSVKDSDIASRLLQTHFRGLVQNGQQEAAAELLAYWAKAKEKEFMPETLWTNNYAYYRGLARTDLENADLSMKSLIENLNAFREFGQIRWLLPYTDKLLTAAALVALDIEKPIDMQPLLLRLDERIERLRVEFEKTSRYLRYIAWTTMNDPRFPTFEADSSLNQARFAVELARRSLAILVAARALVHQRAGELERVEQARQELETLDVDLQELIDKFPPFYICLELIEEGATFLDTHGWILYQREQYGEAFDLIDLAVLSSQIAAHGYEQSEFLFGRSQPAIRDYFRSRQQQTATLLSHRYQIHRVSGDLDAAEEDRKAIENLGFRVDDPRLF